MNGILLIPPLPNLHFQEQTDHFMPLGLFTLAANLKKNHFGISIFKPSRRLSSKKDYQEVAREILSDKPTIIGFSTWCVSYATSLILAENIKKVDPSITILFGGPHASVTAEETLMKYPFIDFILKGEADDSLPLFLSVFFNKQKWDYSAVPGLVYLDSKSRKVTYSDHPILIPDIRRLPMPLYQLAKSKTIKLDVGRGCPYHCTYCSTSDFFSRKFRIKSVDQIIREMDYCYTSMGTTSFGFSHDNFTCNRRFILDFSITLQKYCEKHQVKFTWTCSSRPDTVNEEMLKAMKKAGCTTIFFGIESGSVGIQKIIRKNLKMETVLKVAKICQEQKIQINASFMAGFPGEKTRDIDETLKLMVKLINKGARVQISLLSILPGTHLFNQYKTKLKLDGRFSDFSAYRPTEMEYEMIEKETNLFSSFYYLPNTTLKRDQLFSLSRLVNDLREFHKTAQIISRELIDSLSKREIFTDLISALETYKTNNPKFSELLFLIDQLSNLTQHLYIGKLPDNIKDILVTETAIAVVKRNFLVHRVSDMFRVMEKKSTKRQKESIIFVLPHWTVFKTQNDISSIFKLDSKSFIKPGEIESNGFYYLAYAHNERQTKLKRIKKDEYKVSKNFKTASLEEISKINREIMTEENIYKLLESFQNYRLITYLA